MATRVSSRPTNERFLGNSNSTEVVHDLETETPQCQVDEFVAAGHAVAFTPDTLTQANAEGYDNGGHCLPGSNR